MQAAIFLMIFYSRKLVSSELVMAIIYLGVSLFWLTDTFPAIATFSLWNTPWRFIDGLPPGKFTAQLDRHSVSHPANPRRSLNKYKAHAHTEDDGTCITT